jgi:hypothetical protein
MLSFQSIPASLAIGGGVIAYLAYRRAAGGRRIDLQGEVAKERDSLISLAETLPELIKMAKQSRIALADSQGHLGSEAMQQWLDELEVDVAEAKLLSSQVPAADFEPTHRSVMELDIKLVEILAVSIRANRLADKYRLSLSADEADSRRLLDQSKRSVEPPPALEPSMSLVAPS